ncbi:hypothetical protein D9M71_336540 [compost metagenome]
MLAVVVTDPDQHRTAQKGNEGQEGAAALAQRRAVDQQQGQGQHGQHHRTNGQDAPLRNGDHWPFEVEFLLAGEVEHTPIGANGAFVADLPRLVEGFDDEVVIALAVKLVDQ